MRKLLSGLSIILLLSGCAQTLETQDDIEKNTTVSFDQYSKTATVSGPQELQRDEITLFWLRAFVYVPDIGPDIQLYVRRSGTDWYFLDHAIDINSNPLPTTVISRELDPITPGAVDEDVAVDLSEPYIAQAMSVGINIKLYGQQGSVIVTLPASYVAGFMSEVSKVEAAATPGKLRLGATFVVLDQNVQGGSKLPVGHGVAVVGVQDNTPASRAGLLQDDIIISFNGADITSIDALRTALENTPPGTLVDVQIWRKGEELNLLVQL